MNETNRNSPASDSASDPDFMAELDKIESEAERQKRELSEALKNVPLGALRKPEILGFYLRAAGVAAGVDCSPEFVEAIIWLFMDREVLSKSM